MEQRRRRAGACLTRGSGPIRPDDVAAVVAMVYELAEYERLVEECHLTAEQLHAALFGPQPALFGLVAERLP